MEQPTLSMREYLIVAGRGSRVASNCRGSRVNCRGSRVNCRGSRVNCCGSWVNCRGSRVKNVTSKLLQ